MYNIFIKEIQVLFLFHWSIEQASTICFLFILRKDQLKHTKMINDSPGMDIKIYNTRCGFFFPIYELIKGYTVGKTSWRGTGWNRNAPPYNRAPFQVHWLRHTAELKIEKGKKEMSDIFITEIRHCSLKEIFIFMPKSIFCCDNGWAQARQIKKKSIFIFFFSPS